MKKVVVIRGEMIGDFISGTVPVCKYLQNKYPKCEFYFFVSKTNAPFVHYFFRDAKVVLLPSGNIYKQLLLALKYRNLHPDIAISPFPCRPRPNNLFLKLINAKEKYGIINGKLLSEQKNLTRCLSYNKCLSSHVGLSSLKIYNPSMDHIPCKYYPEFDKSLIPSFAKPICKKNKILVELSNRRKTSQLSVTKTANILNALYEHCDFAVLITIKSDDFSKAVELSHLLKPHAEIFASPRVDEFLSFVNIADLALIGDGGLGHILGALGKKIVALYAKTSVNKWGILSNNVIHLYDSEDVNNISDCNILKALYSLINKNAAQDAP